MSEVPINFFSKVSDKWLSKKLLTRSLFWILLLQHVFSFFQRIVFSWERGTKNQYLLIIAVHFHLFTFINWQKIFPLKCPIKPKFFPNKKLYSLYSFFEIYRFSNFCSNIFRVVLSFSTKEKELWNNFFIDKVSGMLPGWVKEKFLKLSQDIIRKVIGLLTYSHQTFHL